MMKGRVLRGNVVSLPPKAFISRHQCCLVPMPNQASRHPSWHVQVVQHLSEMLKTVGRQKQANEPGKWQITQLLRIWNNAILVMIPQNEAPLEGQNHLRWCTFGFTSEGRTAWVLTNPSMRGNELSCVKFHCQIHMLRIIPLSIFLRKCSVASIESASLLVKELFLHGTSRTTKYFLCS